MRKSPLIKSGGEGWGGKRDCDKDEWKRITKNQTSTKANDNNIESRTL